MKKLLLLLLSTISYLTGIAQEDPTVDITVRNGATSITFTKLWEDVADGVDCTGDGVEDVTDLCVPS